MSVCAVPSRACAKIEVRWTFVHFDERPLALTRSKSAPCEVFVQSVVAVARSLEQRAKQKNKNARNSKLEAKRKQRREEENALREYRQIAAKEMREMQTEQRWMNLTTKMLKDENGRCRREVAQRRKEQLKRSQKLRVTLPLRAFAGICCMMMCDKASISLLTASGKLRENGDDIEIWSEDDEVDAMRYLVEEAMLCRKAYDDHSFIVILAVNRALTTVRIPMMFKFKDDLTIDDVVGRVNTKFGPPQKGQVLKHFDVVLSEGSLCENNVGPGSYVLLTRF
jgi:hypothetical protein